MYNTKEEVMDKQVEAGSETLAGIQTFVARYPFPLDSFQLDAIAELAQGQSVVVAAPTGTGKTLVAEFAIWLAQQRNQRVIYTPLKASQIRNIATCAMYVAPAMSALRPAISLNIAAPLSFMTTEAPPICSRKAESAAGGENPIHLRSPTSVLSSLMSCTIDDIGRGPVGKKDVCSPPHVQLVGLSATVSNADDLATGCAYIVLSQVVHEQRAEILSTITFSITSCASAGRGGAGIESFPNIGGRPNWRELMGRNRAKWAARMTRKKKNFGRAGKEAEPPDKGLASPRMNKLP
jgi:hypothetical protein